ncbi:alpha/beta hydrolase [Schaalia odontolytica]|uniref:Alpha/beta hydrolase n=1 Tax=Schaalia odontolytica TaxID=1660 RepID=A0A0V8RYS0_9ACTO|nr:alpha/beta hydrolase [Schaalia odontolytica]KSW13197.1 alpha/beta hydrolase [Schaalia odontolytica]QCT36310.1 alpha/beta hydrolase [Schaalia odontolytica]
MATWADIQSWELSYVEEAEDLIEAEVREAREIIADLEHAANDIRSQGEGPDRMRERLTEIQDKLDSCLNELTEYALATAELHGYVSRVVAKRKSAWEVAAEVGYDIPESGLIEPDALDKRFEPVPRKFDELRDCIDDAVRIATEAEETVGPRYQALADGRYVLAEGRHSASAGLADDADPAWSPEEVSVWWALLSESEREALINKDPEKYGNLNGIDMASRARANELALNGHVDAAGNRIPGTGLIEKTQNELDELNQEIDRMRENGQEVSSDLLDKQENLQNRLADLNAISEQLGSNAGATLLVLEPGNLGENVRAAIAIGDVDNAQHVATFVPGMGSNFRDNGRLNVEFAKNLKWAADTYGAPTDGSVATIAWIGYEAPPDIVKTWDTSVTSIDKAEAGAEKLNGFVTGIHSWRSERGLDVHQSIIPHSYGSTTAGIAMRDIGEGVVDELVYTGSPGAGVSAVGTLGVDADHTWVSATPHLDPVRGIGPDSTFGRNPEHLEGIGHLSGDTSGGEGYKHGIWHRPDGNHSSYFHKPDKEGKHNYALEDIGKVIVGKKERQ